MEDKKISRFNILEKNLSAIYSDLENPNGIYLIIDKNVYDKFAIDLFAIDVIRENVESTFVIEPLETSKTMSVVNECVERFARYGVDKNSLIVNIGGGLTTDIGGFIASIYMRGIKFVNVPTTIVGMADAAIGGKNGINMWTSSGLLKNYIGTINLPYSIIIDYDFLDTLPEIEKDSGIGEIIKSFCIFDPIAYQETKDLNSRIIMSRSIKEKICEDSRYEDKGTRLLLNLGHTFGHAIESYYNGELPHGYCVMLGLLYDMALSEHIGTMKPKSFNDIIEMVWPYLSRLDKRYLEYDNRLKRHVILSLLYKDKKKCNRSIDTTVFYNWPTEDNRTAYDFVRIEKVPYEEFEEAYDLCNKHLSDYMREHDTENK